MLTLALDTAGVDRTTVCLVGDGGFDGGFIGGATVTASPAEQLVPLIARVLDEAGIALADVTRVVAGNGPGPFTGLRIGLAHARAAAHALGVPVVGVSSLAAVAFAYGVGADQPDVVVATDARRKEVYCAVLRGGLIDAESVAVMTPAGAAQRYAGLQVVGDGCLKYADVFTANGCIPVNAETDHARGLCAAVMSADALGAHFAAEPAYLREPDAVPSVQRPLVPGQVPT